VREDSDRPAYSGETVDRVATLLTATDELVQRDVVHFLKTLRTNSGDSIPSQHTVETLRAYVADTTRPRELRVHVANYLRVHVAGHLRAVLPDLPEELAAIVARLKREMAPRHLEARREFVYMAYGRAGGLFIFPHQP